MPAGKTGELTVYYQIENFFCCVAKTTGPNFDPPAAFDLINDFSQSKVTVVNKKFFAAMFHFHAVMLALLTWNSLAFGGDIHQAAIIDDLDTVKKMLKDNPSLVSSKEQYYSNTPLHSAAEWGNTEIVKLLLTYNADINATNSRGETPLHKAAQHSGRREIVNFLLANKANLNAKDTNGLTPLHTAELCGRRDVVVLLLTNKAEINVQDNQGRTPLHFAVNSGRKDMVELLLANKADIDARSNHGVTPLHEAAMGGMTDIAKLLLAKGANINAKDNSGWTPLRYVVSREHKDLVELLRQHGGHE